MNRPDPKQSVRELLEEAHPALIGLSHWIHANPEMGFEEHHASDWVNEWLQTAGFQVERGVADMPTALVGRFGPGPLHVTICVEYDALPEIGHACGHNIIAAAGVGAGLALASVAGELGLRVSVLGTPAEESGGGKLGFIEAGFFEDVHLAAMIHPWPTDVVAPNVIAITQLDVTYRGREAHAAGFPHLGRNAADAMVVAQTAIGLLRQQLLPSDRVHGIVTRGGDAPNIIPALTTARFMVRAQDRARLDELTGLVRRCFEAGAIATGCEVELVEGTRYANMIHDADLVALYRHNAEQLGRVFDDTPGAPVSTDMGDVSHIVPSIHPMIGIESNGAVNHQREFADACATPSADRAILDGALGLAWTVIDAAQSQVIRARLMGDAVIREAVAIVEEVQELDTRADLLDDLAGTVAVADPELATHIAAAADALEERADDLADLADSRFEEAQQLTDQALLDEVASEMESDLEDMVAALDASDQVADAGAVEEPSPVDEGAILAEVLIVEALANEVEGIGQPDTSEPDFIAGWEPVGETPPTEEGVGAYHSAEILSGTRSEGSATMMDGTTVDAAAEAEPGIDAEAMVEIPGIALEEVPQTLVSASATWQEPHAEDGAHEPGQDAAEASRPPVAPMLDRTHAAWERDFLDVVRHASWAAEFAGAVASTPVGIGRDDGPAGDAGASWETQETVAQTEFGAFEAEPETLEAVAEAEPQPETLEAVAEAGTETLEAAAETFEAEPQPETLEAVAEAEHETLPETLEAVAEAGTEPAWEQPVAEAGTEPAWEQPVAEAGTGTLEAVAEAFEAEPETLEAVAEAGTEPAWEQPVAEAGTETLEAAAEAEPETLEAVAEAEPETLEAVAEAEPETLPETLEAVAEAGTEPAWEQPVAEAGTETLEAAANAESEPLGEVDDIWYSGAPDDELPAAERVAEEPVGVAAAADRTQGFVWIPADEDR